MGWHERHRNGAYDRVGALPGLRNEALSAPMASISASRVRASKTALVVAPSTACGFGRYTGPKHTPSVLFRLFLVTVDLHRLINATTARIVPTEQACRWSSSLSGREGTRRGRLAVDG